jgi:hypothetical protein
MQEFLVRGAPIPLYKQLKLGLPAKRALIQLWKRQRPDLVHIATEGPLGWSALQAARKLKLPVCTDFRTNFHAYSQYYGLGWLKGAIFSYMKKFHNMAQYTMVPTQETHEQLKSLGFERLLVVARGVDNGMRPPTPLSYYQWDAWLPKKTWSWWSKVISRFDGRSPTQSWFLSVMALTVRPCKNAVPMQFFPAFRPGMIWLHITPALTCSYFPA